VTESKFNIFGLLIKRPKLTVSVQRINNIKRCCCV